MFTWPWSDRKNHINTEDAHRLGLHDNFFQITCLTIFLEQVLRIELLQIQISNSTFTILVISIVCWIFSHRWLVTAQTCIDCKCMLYTDSIVLLLQAYYARDALSKATYRRMFSWLIQRVNDSIRVNNILTCIKSFGLCPVIVKFSASYVVA